MCLDHESKPQGLRQAPDVGAVLVGAHHAAILSTSRTMLEHKTCQIERVGEIRYFYERGFVVIMGGTHQL